jgi:hypothetical protein
MGRRFNPRLLGLLALLGAPAPIHLVVEERHPRGFDDLDPPIPVPPKQREKNHEKRAARRARKQRRGW